MSLNVRIKHKHDTTANWLLNDPVLLLGEIGVDDTLNNIKVGDGTSKWSELEYITKTDAIIVSSLNDVPADMSEDGIILLSDNTDISGSVIQPIITSPSNNSTVSDDVEYINISLGLFSCSVYNDIHYASRYKITTDMNGLNVFYDSGVLTANKYGMAVDISDTTGLVPGQDYYIWAKFIGEVLGESPWSNSIKFTVTGYATTPTLLAPIENTRIKSGDVTIISSSYSVEGTNQNYVHLGSDWKITSDSNGENIVAEVTNSSHLIAHTFSGLSFTPDTPYYAWCRHLGSYNKNSRWAKTQFSYTSTGRALYRHSSGKGTVMEFNDGTQRKVIILDAEYRTAKQFGTYGTDSPLQNYGQANKNGNWYVHGINSATSPLACAGLSDAFLNYMWQNMIDRYTSKERGDTWMTYASTTGFTDAANILGVPAVEWCRSIEINGTPCDLPNFQTLLRIYCDADAIDALDPTVPLYPSRALGSVNSNGYWRIAGSSYSWSSTERSSGNCWGIGYNGYVDNDSKDYTYSVLPVLEIS